MSEYADAFLPPEQPAVARPTSTTLPVSDVRLFLTPDGGDIEIIGGLITMSDGLETAVLLSLFGGNERDSGLACDDHLQWWGNVIETDEDRKYRSQTQYLLRALPATTANLRRIEDAVDRDLAWLKRDIAQAVVIAVSIPRLNSLQIDVTLVLHDGAEQRFQLAESWGSRPSEGG